MKLVVHPGQNEIDVVKAATQQFQVRCGAFFHRKRLQQNKTENGVADFLAVSVQTVRDYEGGQKAIPLHRVFALSVYLEIPPKEIMELHLDLERTLPKPLFEQNLREDQSPGEVVRQARKTVFLSSRDLARLLSRAGHPISEREILEIESGSRTASVEFWQNLCTLIHLPCNTARKYCRWEHLAQVELALQNHEIRIPVGSKLFNALERYREVYEGNRYKISYLMQFSLALRQKWTKWGVNSL